MFPLKKRINFIIMEKATKGLIILATPLVVGFFFGFLVGSCSGSHRAEKKAQKARNEEPVEQIQIPVNISAQDLAQVEESSDQSDSSEVYEEPQQKEIIYYTNKISYPKAFADLNDAHVELAKAVGLRSIPKDRDAVVKDKLTLVADNDYYVVDNLRYSVPYLTKSAAAELNAIGKAFNDSLKRKQFPEYKLVVSSVLRTQADLDRLRRSGNPNASENSAHCYGTTFDITYTRYFREEETDEFMQPYELTKVLAEVLRDQKKAGRILVKYEKHEHCFHITAK